MRHLAAVPPSARDLGQRGPGDRRDPASRGGRAASSLRRSHGMMPGGRWAGRGTAQQKHRGLKPQGHTRQSLELRPTPSSASRTAASLSGAPIARGAPLAASLGLGTVDGRPCPQEAGRPDQAAADEMREGKRVRTTAQAWAGAAGVSKRSCEWTGDGARNAIRLGESGGVGGQSPRSCEPGRKPWAGRQVSGQKSSCPRSPLLGICHRKSSQLIKAIICSQPYANSRR